jgi:hypothetical protein
VETHCPERGGGTTAAIILTVGSGSPGQALLASSIAIRRRLDSILALQTLENRAGGL